MNWNQAAPFLQDALDRSGNEYTLEQVRARLDDGRTQFWPGRRSAAVTEIVQVGEKLVLNCWLAGGDLDELRDMIDAAEVFAARMGCDSVQVSGRKGWVRALRDKGYEPIAYTVEKELTDG